MVGGSVNGKPFKPDPTSYEQTGIPCGNPARYQSHGVIRMNRSDRKPFEDQRLGVPGTGTESEADQHLRGLVKNQLDTNITLQSQLSRKKSFQSSSTYAPFCPEKCGALSLKDYQSLQTHEQCVQVLKECGFNDEEIQFKLEQEGHLSKAPKRNRFGANPAAEQEKLKDLETRIKKREEALAEPDLYSNVRVLSRHALEVEQSLQKGTPKASHLSHLVQRRQQDTPVNDPLLETLLEQDRILSKSKVKPSTSTIEDWNSETLFNENTSKTVGDKTKKCLALVDDHDGQSSASNTQSGSSDVLADVRPIDEREIIDNRLTSEQIKEIPKFSNYQPGEPNQVLFVKNLHHKATEADLASLFIRFQDRQGPRIIFRLMKGKMNGQAFVTMPDISSATAALNLVNGYIFKGKPIIIQYGRQRKGPPDTSDKPGGNSS